MHRLFAPLGAALFLASLSVHSAKDEIWICSQASDVRKISVLYTSPGTALPCEVRFEVAGVERTVWSATAEEGFCEQKADTLIVKQIGLGWQCERAEPDGN